MATESEGGASAGLSRRTFIGAVTAAATATAISVGGAAGAASASSSVLSARRTGPTATVLPSTAGFAQADLSPATGTLGGWGDTVSLAFDGNRRSVGLDLGSAEPFTAIELLREADSDPYQRLNLKTGVLTGDANPATGVLANFTVTGSAALDFNRRSLGMDFGAERVVRRLQLHARGATTRVLESHWTIWVSNDNATWVPLTGWTFTPEVVDGRIQHTFDGFEVTTRYVKINSTWATTSGQNFVLDTPLENARAFGGTPPVEPGPTHRITSRDLSLWVSDDNLTWDRVPDLHLVTVGTSLWLYGFEAVARYVKIHMYREDTGAESFLITNIQTGARVHQIPAGAFVAPGGGAWSWITPILVTNPTSGELRDRAVFIPADDLDIDGLVQAGRLHTDLRDLRFAAPDGSELHAYADGEGFYVRIPQIGAGEDLEIQAHSGNPAAASRVDWDAAALQVEYGQRSLIPQTDVDAWGIGIKIVHLPTGLMMAAAGNGGDPSVVAARFSADGGRTWSGLEQLTPVFAGARSVSTGGFILDPDTDVLSMFFLVQTAYTAGGDFSDPAQNNVQPWIVQTTGYDGAGRPIFGTPRHIPLQVQSAGRAVTWGLSYANGLITSSGAYLYPVSYMKDAVGTMTRNIIRSTDNGLTWVQSPVEFAILGAPVGYERGITESAMTELDDGKLLFIARQQDMSKHYFVTATSSDDGVTWDALQDSEILSSNTAPALFRDGRGGRTLTWPGHNGFGMVSYYRNNFTAAYSDDDGESWHGYQDLLAASSMSTPGWANINDTRAAVNADSWKGDGDARVFAWGRPSRPYMIMHIDDFDAFVRDSHGALDSTAYHDPSAAASGAELTASRWWRTTRMGTLDLAEGRRAGRHAVRLRFSEYDEAGASRLFPAIRQARIRFALRFSGLQTDLRLALQEGFSAHQNARGTALSLKITPGGELLVTTDDTFAPSWAVGHSNNDADPATGNLSAIGTHQLLGYDFQNRSVGADFGSPREITGLELVDNEFVSRPGNRLDPAVLQVWVSDTNAGDWTLVSDWTGTKTGSVVTLSGPPVTTRFVKISHPYSDTLHTVANDEQRMLRVLPDTGATQVFGPMTVPTTLQDGTWHRFEIQADIPGDQIVVIVDGTERGSLPVLHPAAVLTHLLLLGGPAGSGEVRIDDLLVQDTASGLPALTSVGAAYAAGSTPAGGGGGSGQQQPGNGAPNGGGGSGVELPRTGRDGGLMGSLAAFAALGAAVGGGLLMLRGRGADEEEGRQPGAAPTA